jgi:hypothetical protein
VDLGIAPIDHLAVHPDFAVTVRHGWDDYAHGISFGLMLLWSPILA